MRGLILTEEYLRAYVRADQSCWIDRAADKNLFVDSYAVGFNSALIEAPIICHLLQNLLKLFI